MSIPKKIHYCWFGGGKIPEAYQAFIEEWKTVCPDYEIIKWDESNYDVNKVAFMREAAAVKNWTFIADYARFDIVNTHGGVYLDVDVQTLKNYDQFLELDSFWGMEMEFNHQYYVNPGLGFGSAPGNPVLQELLELYQSMHFDNDNIVPSPVLLREFFEQRGFVQKNVIQQLGFGNIYPKDYFAPLNCLGKLKKTRNTVSIHHYMASWIEKPKNTEFLMFKKCVYYFGETAGEYLFQILRRIKHLLGK